MMFSRMVVTLCLLLSLSMIDSAAQSGERMPAKRPINPEQVKPASKQTTAEQPPAKKSEALPLWEVGIGGGVGWTPDYPAAGENSFRGLALPFAKYRGEFFQADGGSARGIFVNTSKVEFDISLAGSLPADSDDNDAREGLDDLDFLGEIGPRLSYFFERDAAGNEKRIDIALRAVLSTNFTSDFDYVGLIFHPAYVQEFVDVGGIDKLEANWSIGARWADEGVMDLFYEVPVEGVTADRAAFDADPGYLGTNLFGAIAYPVTDHLRLAVAGNLANYSGSKNRDSDLFIDQWNIGIGFGVVWTLWKSETRSKAHR